MKFKDFKTHFIESWVQFVLVDKEGNFIESCDSLFKLTGKRINVLETFPFIDSIKHVLDDLKVGEEISFPCIYLNDLGFNGYCDYVFYKVNFGEKERILWILMDFSDHYKNLINLQQQRNESMLQKELLEIEMKNTLLSKELLEYKNNELERIQKSKTYFFSGVCHEIRTPVNGILGLAELLLENKESRSSTEYIEAIYEISRHLSTIVTDVLSTSKIDANKITFESIDFDIYKQVRSVVNSFAYIGKEKGLKVSWEIAHNVPKFLRGDKTKLSQILYNLLSNAVKFTNEGCIDLSVNFLRSEGTRCWLRFEVQDTGVGIPEDKLDKIFAPYEQADTSTDRLYGGTGLGLYIVKKITELQAGNISVESHLDEGTKFGIELSFETVEMKPDKLQEPSNSQNTSLKGLKVLVGEDNLINQKVLKEFFKKWQVNVDIVENGQLLLEKFKNSDYEVLLIDYRMPVLDGFEAIKTIRNGFDSSKNEVPIIVFTGESNKDILRKFEDIKVSAILNKPIEPKELFRKITDIIERRQKKFEHLYDLTYVKEMADGNPSIILEMIDIFVETVPPDLKKMKKLWESQNIDGLKVMVHKIRPNYQYMGITQLESEFDYLEKEIFSDTDVDIINNKLALIETITEKSIHDLNLEKLKLKA